MLQMRFRQTYVSRPTHAKRTHPLGEGAFNTGSSCILVLKFGGELTFTHSLEGFMVQLGPHEQGTGLGFCSGTGGPYLTGPTVLWRKADLDHLLTGPVALRMPFGTPFASWARRGAGSPVDGECTV